MFDVHVAGAAVIGDTLIVSGLAKTPSQGSITVGRPTDGTITVSRASGLAGPTITAVVGPSTGTVVVAGPDAVPAAPATIPAIAVGVDGVVGVNVVNGNNNGVSVAVEGEG